MLKRFSGMDEKYCARSICKDYEGLYCDAVRQADSDIELRLANSDNSGTYGPKQKSMLKARLVNHHLAHMVSNSPYFSDWEVDTSGYSHFRHMQSGMNMVFRAANKVKGRQPVTGGTFAARARYTQIPIIDASEMTETIFEYPDLSSIDLVLACDYSSLDSVFLRVYRSLTPATWWKAGTVAYSFPLYPDQGGDWDRSETPFEPDPEEEDLVAALLAEKKSTVRR